MAPAAARPPIVQQTATRQLMINEAKSRLTEYFGDIKENLQPVTVKEINDFITPLLAQLFLNEQLDIYDAFMNRYALEGDFKNAQNFSRLMSVLKARNSVCETRIANQNVIKTVLNMQNPDIKKIAQIVADSLRRCEDNLKKFGKKTVEWRELDTFIQQQEAKLTKPLTEFQRQYLQDLRTGIAQKIALETQKAASSVTEPGTSASARLQVQAGPTTEQIESSEKFTAELFRNIAILGKEGDDTLKAQQRHIIIDNIQACLEVLPRETMPMQAMVIPEKDAKDAKIFVIGDIHCSYDKFLAQIQQMRELNCFVSPRSLLLKPNQYLVFTGDYADRGLQGTEVFMLAMGLKRLNPQQVFLGRGNHEQEVIANRYGFFNDELNRFGAAIGEETVIKDKFLVLFSHLPVALFLGTRRKDGTVSFGMFNHAALPTNRFYDTDANKFIKETIKGALEKQGVVYTKETKLSLESGLMWGDYISGKTDIERPNIRGVQGLFDVTLMNAHATITQYLEEPGYTIDFIARAHQHQAGLEQGGIYILNPEQLQTLHLFM